MLAVIRRQRGKTVYFIDGKEVTKAAFDEALPDAEPPKPVPKPRNMKRGYPIKMVSAAVTKKRRKTMIEECAKRGVPTEYTAGGRPVIRDAAHRKQFMRAFGYHDRNCYN